jgi:phosphatidate cytidylyltransferase
MKTRILVAIPIALVLIAALVVQSWLLVALIALISIVGQAEMLRALASRGAKPVWAVAMAFCLLTLPVLLGSGTGMLLVAFVLCIMAAGALAMFGRKTDFEGVQKTVLAMAYPQLFLVFAYLIVFEFTNMQPVGSNPIVLVMAVLPPIFCDIFAYFFGCAFGKKKLCPHLSPKKTVAGAVAGVAGGLIAGFLVWLLMASGLVFRLTFAMPLGHFLLLGALIAVCAQAGDLFASFIKRHYEIKDFGHLLPGHGGILDRIDSILYALPIVYLYFIVYNASAAMLR